MEGSILDVVLGLVLVYLVLALLVSKLQETVIGRWRAGRTKTMNEMVLEAVGRNEALRKQIYANPAIFALSEGETEGGQRAGLFLISKGPSAIPPNLFARVLLVELYNKGDGAHPSSRWNEPQGFVNALAPQSSSTASENIWVVMRTLLAGREANWPAFETAIAEWFTDIGHRADGWYQRVSQRWSLRLALLVAVALNVNSFNLAERLASDPIARRAMATLAQQVNAVFPGGKDATTAAGTNAALPPAALAPAVRADQAMQQASMQLAEAYFRHPDVAKFDTNRQALGSDKRSLIARCALPLDNLKVNSSDTNLSNPSTWVALLPSLRAYVKQQRLPESFTPSAAASSAQAASKPTARWCKPSDKSNGASCELDQEALNAAARQAGGAAAGEFVKQAAGDLSKQIVKELAKATQKIPAPAVPEPKPLPEETRKDKLHNAYHCITNLTGWVSMAAEGASADAEVKSKLRNATASLDLAADALQELIEDQGTGVALATLFQTDPAAFEDCLAEPNMTRSRLHQCTAAAAIGKVNLPIGWTGSNIRLGYCKVQVARRGEAPPASGDCPFNGQHVFAGHAGLGISAMWLSGQSVWEWVLSFGGFFVTALFVALGAPFWFDALGKVVKLRAAGSERAPEAKSVDGSAVSAAATAAPSESPSPFLDALNEYEKLLLPADKIALQNALNVTPTGVLDIPTRNAIAERAKTLDLTTGEQLSPVVYDLIVHRAAIGPSVKLPPVSAVVSTGQPHAQAAALANALMKALHFEGRITGSPSRVDDDLRALAVLYRYKRDASNKVAWQDRPVVKDARTPGKLDEIPQALIDDILATGTSFEREVPPWMDWAIGELGQVEQGGKTREDSNPRILQYLDLVGIRAASDNSADAAWCGAFVSWVFISHNALKPTGAPSVGSLPARPETAESWKGWGTPRGEKPLQAAAAAQPGDVVVVHPDKPKGEGGGIDEEKFHVAFVFAVEQGFVHALGGNQANGTAVCISGFRFDQVVSVCKPPEA